MKYIVNMTNEVLIIGGMTIGPGPNAKVPVLNLEILDWPDTKALLTQGKIRIEDSTEQSQSSES